MDRRNVEVLVLAAVVLTVASAVAFVSPQSNAATYDGEFDLYGYKITLELVEPDSVETVEWDFGDGSEHQTVTLTSDNPLGSVKHTYAAKGDYTVTATMRNQYTDSSGQTVDGESVLTYLCHIYGYPVVTFDSEGGSTVPSIEGTASHYVPTEPDDPEKADCIFLGWFTDEACTQAFDWTSEVTKHITLHAGWRSETYTSTLNFDANNGTGGPSAQTDTHASKSAHVFTIPSTEPTRAGFAFMGWAESADATVATYKAGNGVSVAYDGTKTLYAVWKAVLEITSVPSGSATAGTAWSYLPAVNAEGCTLSVSGADWLSVSDGKIAGTPMRTGTYSITVTASKDGCVSAVQTFDVVVGPSPFDAPPTAEGIIAEEMD